MRVIAGSARGISLTSVKGDKTRPIQDRTKESLFNILSGIIRDSRVMDLYAGTGAIGIEALSRGASSCIFVEHNKQVVQIIKDNLTATGLQNKATVIKCDVLESASYLEREGIKLDIVFAAPPYPLVEKNAYRSELLTFFSILSEKHIIQPEGIVILQQRKAEFQMPPEASCLELFDTRMYGDTQVLFFRIKAIEKNV
ncbi:MAG TPA: 16S rRNA (guanine(966)-N(2))-methyltransferase RsmD [Candidatus Brocadiaceae bacterium]|nr:16S rRNA (guanine(966)-N(2))-methyltransferase RsmD [Candidatus Brocadiaceae bacterium]